MNAQTRGLLITTLGVLFIVPDSLFIRLIDADGLTISFWRSLISGSVILLGLFVLKGRGALKTVVCTGRNGLIYAVFLGLSGVMFVLAVSLTSVANVVFIIASMPIFAALFSWFLMGERISRRMVMTIVVVAGGLGVIAYGSGNTENTSLAGDLIAFGTASSFAMALTFARKSRATSMVPAIPIAFLGAAAVLAPFADIWAVQPDQWWLFALHGGVVVTVSMSLLSIGPRYIPSAEVSLLMLLESVLAPLLVWYVLNEYPGNWTLAGGAVVVGALLVSNLVVLLRKRPEPMATGGIGEQTR